MRKVYLLGGESIKKRDGEEVNEAAFQAAGGSPNVLVFSWARASFDNFYLRQKMVHDYLRYLGAQNVEVVDFFTPKEELKEKVSQTDLIYLTGGSPSILVERFRRMGVHDLLAGYEGVIVGRSAGAVALCKICVVTVRGSKRVKVVEGLGLIDITMKAHYAPEKDEALKALSMGNKIFAVPTGSGLVYDRGAFSCINRVFLFENGERQKIVSAHFKRSIF
jgi:putative intracellular protease/amidase